MAISTTSFSKTPQAVGDTYTFYEDQLLGSNLLSGTIVSLDVMSNDLGGNARVLYSIDDGLTFNSVSSANDLLLADALILGKSAWEATQSTINNVQLVTDDVLRIDNGKIDIDISHSLFALTGTTDVNALAGGDHIHDSFIYAIRLGNGTLSWATTTVDIYGQNDAASISGNAAGTLTEDATVPVTGTLTVTDPDHGQSHTQLATNVASIGGLGTYSIDADGHWSYTVNNALVQYLNANQSTTDSFVVSSLDGAAQQTVTITITGIDDVCDPVLSFSRTDYAAGAGPEWFSIADLNGDGKLDLTVSNIYSSTISSLLGNGDGTFQPPTSYSAPPNHSIATGDLNGDGKLDLVSTDSDTNNVFSMLGNGDGSFQPPTLYPAGFGTSYAAIADLNGDGKLDVIATEQSANGVSVLLGNGDGSFQLANFYGAGQGPGYVAVADLNGDGKLDLAVTNNGSIGLVVLLGNGDGSFGSFPVTYTTGASYNVAIGDLNGDGKQDLVVGGSPLSILRGNGDGNFDPLSFDPLLSGQVAVGDLTCDGILDLAVVNGLSNTVSVLQGNGDFTFQDVGTFAVGANAFAVATADLNGDGMLDLAVSNLEGATLSILLNQTDLFAI
jgi:VCBS repeat-containing protein